MKLSKATMTSTPPAQSAQCKAPAMDSQFPFEKLPGELRNQIYQEVLVQDVYKIKSDDNLRWNASKKKCEPSGFRFVDDNKAATLQCFALNHQIYAEAKSLFWAQNTFCVVAEEKLPITTARFFLAAIGKSGRDSIQHLEVADIIREPWKTSLQEGADSVRALTSFVNIFNFCWSIKTLHLDLGLPLLCISRESFPTYQSKGIKGYQTKIDLLLFLASKKSLKTLEITWKSFKYANDQTKCEKRLNWISQRFSVRNLPRGAN
ncbi:uncharacterized protein BDZ99DRAFT_60288 [Mytilinidion resinicola]|uniref:Uncharacterized protein n=1 Tax=Mytilinidion resinicola TaxID=574789 RepID=A0A6A6YJF4_9PEZI|nr:uncharacterized protein BDZ99DRAFT_60288 [Mytilinidion resinicola]KAF2808653.1 hypothetical protein BDZ99DRAFT_60288 [Mytilinidion resinicola]